MAPPASRAFLGLLFILPGPAGARHDLQQCSDSPLPCDATQFLQTTVTTDADIAPGGDGSAPPAAPKDETFASQWQKEVEAQKPDRWRVLYVLFVASALLAVRLLGQPSTWLWSNTSPPLGQLPVPPKPATDAPPSEADGHKVPAKEAEDFEVFLEPVTFGGW